MRVFACFIGLFALSVTVIAEESEEHGLNALPDVALSALSGQDQNPLGAKALAIQVQDWKHGETEHFIYHFIHSYVATPVSVEAEFNFRLISRELGRDEMSATLSKSHIYIFEKPAEWKTFQANAQLEPWTGGIHSRGSLFIKRDPANKFANHLLGHEIAHLILWRIYGHDLPRWLDEGFAEYISRISKATFERERNYDAHARSRSIPGSQFIPVAQLLTMDYPDAPQVHTFYDESERLVRYLVSSDRTSFLGLLEAIGNGEAFDTALARNYASRFFDVSALEKEFAAYATQSMALNSSQ